jgi:lycopene beta-cyclase
LQKASEHPHVRIEVGVAARDVHAGRVLLQDGRTLVADCVIDARGRSAATDCAGWQKFVGLDVELALASPGHRPLPCIMDATVPQQDGYRFFYTLPFTATRWLVEETFFSDSPELSVEEARPRILDYIENRLAARVVALHRVETGVLPMPWRSTPTADHGAFLAGYQGGWFHPATGYSLPVAVRLAEEIAKLYPLTPSAWTLAHFRRRHDRQTRFAHWLNAWLFRAFDPERRWNIFERFYGLPLDTISRFYSLEMTLLDRARLFVGRPPEGISFSRFFARRPGR